MATSPSNNPYGNTELVDRLIGTAYDIVKLVAENLQFVKHVSINLPHIAAVSEGIEQIKLVEDHLDQIVAVAADIANIDNVSEHILSVITVSAQMEQLLAVYQELDNILVIASNITAVSAVGTNIDAVLGVFGGLDSIQDMLAVLPQLEAVIAQKDEILDAKNAAEAARDAAEQYAQDALEASTGAGLASDAETIAGESTNKVTTPHGVRAAWDVWKGEAQALSMVPQSFAGVAGSNIDYTLSVENGTTDTTIVFVGGIRQVPTVDYTVTGDTLTILANPDGLEVDSIVFSGSAFILPEILDARDVAVVARNQSVAARDLARAWAEGTEPGGPDTKSAKEWSLTGPADGTITKEKLHANVAVRLMEFDIRDSQFAGGAKWNDIDNDDAAFAAAIAYFKTLNPSLSMYEGKGSAVLHLPRGMGRIGVDSVDLSAAHNVSIEGESNAATGIRLAGNFPAFKTLSVTTPTTTEDSHHRVGLADFTIHGPGRSFANAHGIDFQSVNNGFIRDVRFYSLRDAIRLRNAWQFEIIRPKIDGGPTVGGGLTCYRGIAMLNGLHKDGSSNTVIENGAKIFGGIISGVETVGFRGESISGSMVMGLEVLACGQTGVLLGDNPGGKPTKWFTWTGGMIDTCGDLLAIIKGASSECTNIHFSGMWLGYANAGGGNGDALRLQGVTKSTFRPDMVANVDTAFVAVDCTGVTYEAGTIDGYDRSLVGSTGIILQNTLQSKISVGRATKWTGSPSTTFLAETTGSDFNILSGINADNTMTVIGASTVVDACRPFKARAKGAVDIVSGQSSVVVTHGLGRAPTRGEIQVTPRHSLASVGASSFYVEADTSATTFTIRTNAAVSGGIGFDWFGDVSRG